MTTAPSSSDSTTFSAAEAAVYDRQMRLWGVEAQKRLQTSHVLVSGLGALGAELVKNLVLSGMNVTLHDTEVVTETAVATQFFFDAEHVGQNRAVACLARVQELNPLVQVSSETRPLAELTDSALRRFSVVCLVGAREQEELRLDAFCRANGIAFFAARSFGFSGVLFADLGRHTFRRAATSADAPPADPVTVEFPSLEAARAVSWGSLQSARKRGPQLPRVFVQHQLLQAFERLAPARRPADDVDAFVAMARAELPRQGLSAELFSADELRALALHADVELAPVSAILAGVAGQEVIKAVSQRDEPVCNVFAFDGAAGVVRRVG
ncbi:hypothetical protein ATCC90586_000200 [Pythium insidiosum]|nr:hypothetical protein ATCC90586_000200 [Pythium insidiosum]